MDGNAPHAHAALDAWRAQGLDRIDPVRFHYMDALRRRASGHDGEVRRQLEQRLSALIDAYGELVASAATTPSGDDAASPAISDVRGPLGQLADLLTARPKASAGIATSAVADIGSHDVCRDDAGDADMVERFRRIWSEVRSQSQLRQSLEQAPTNAGPLNSAQLVHRMLLQMEATSPAYLRHFLLYVDNLSWLDRINGIGAPDVALPQASRPKRGRGKPRKRAD